MSKPKKEQVILGSGKLYHMEFTGTVPANEEIEKDENILASVKGGAAFTYTPTTITEESDEGDVSVTVFQSDEATFKSGLMTVEGETFKTITSTARVETKDGVETVLIGGAENHDGKTHLFHFVNNNKLRPVRATVVGVNQKGFELSFKQDGASIIDLEVKAEALDDKGTKIKLQLGNKVTA